MSEQPYNLGGYLPGGFTEVTNHRSEPESVIGKQIFVQLANGRVIGPSIIEFASFQLEDEGWSAEIVTAPKAYEHSVTFEQLPPRTRREKRDRKAFHELFFGGPLPKPAQPVKRRQLIHNGRKS
jgi:hypothetical protein